MSSFIPPRPVLHSDDEDREAPSSVLHACTSQARWYLVTGLVCCAFAGLVLWYTYELSESIRMISEARGSRPGQPGWWMLAWGGECSVLALGSGLLLFRSFSAIHRLKESRRVSDLHRALRRMRTVWRMFGLSLPLALLPPVVLQVWDWISP